MKRLLLAGIRGYWRFVPPAKRRTCLFAQSCSRHVFDVAEREGFAAGIRALIRRYLACRPGYRLLDARDRDGTGLMLLADGSVVRVDLLSTQAVLLGPAQQSFAGHEEVGEQAQPAENRYDREPAPAR